MGYQVGRVCYFTHEAATNQVMTLVVPTIDKDGVLHHPVLKGATWQYKEQVVKLTFPQCEYGAYAMAGKQIGTYVIGAFAALLVVVICVKAVSLVSEKDEE